MITNLKFVIYLLAAILGNPFYQMVSYFVCQSLGWGSEPSFNVYQANPMGYLFILVVIFIIRFAIYSRIFTSKEYPMTIRGSNNFLYLFAERHLFQLLGFYTLWLWAQELEGNVIGFLVLPLTLITGIVISVVTFIRMLKLKKKWRQMYSVTPGDPN